MACIRLQTIICGMALLVLAGCMPPGPRALLKGRELLEAGRYAEAMEQLNLATSLLSSNAQAWNYLGLACHHAGDAGRAEAAYQQALIVDRDLFEAHFNLGCLWLEEGRWDAAKNQFTSCTLRRGTSIESWLKLGTAQYRGGEWAAAEASFQKARGLDPNHVEVLNGLGLVCVQKRRAREATQYFAAALKQSPDYPPALLNLATVLYRDLNDAAGAAQRYREFLATLPPPDAADQVRAILRTLEQGLTPPLIVQTPIPVLSNTVTSVTSVTNVPRVAVAVPTPPAKTNPPAVAPRLPVTNVVRPVEIVQLPVEPVLHPVSPAPDANSVAPPASSTASSPASGIVTSAAPVAASEAPLENTNSSPAAPAEKRSFFSRLNPFRQRRPPPTNVDVSRGADTRRSSPAQLRASSFPRYTYLSPTSPAPGNRTEAEAALERGRQAEQSGKLDLAAHAYQQAVQADPAFYEANYRLALTQYARRDYSAALGSWENTLAVRADSADARYSFALTLQAAGFPVDAASELERIIERSPRDTRTHLTLGNLYAEQLRDTARARVHYQRILELDPRHPQATAIRYWLVANPG